ncbi:MAG: tRNA uridine-5-carboxymethylaminomethyl(34) synthesis GTPase MnmE [Chlamydiae bacterium]|nr:tRNA uridine-5-carboxymethylaminomethyl(34) synthesis GTPase MnmE [Chlamydiota bacterium]
MMSSLDDTIASIATPPGEGAIGIIRLSGPQTLTIADHLFRSKKGCLPSSFKSHHFYFGEICEENETIDEGMACLMRSPKSYTKENIFEIHCHGGPYILKRVLSLSLEKGARLAEPGEFTKRAFLNGRMDLSQAEGVIDLIQSKTEYQRKYALKQVQGLLSQKLLDVRASLFHVMVETQANIDFPDYVPEEVSKNAFTEILKKVRHIVQDFLKSAKIQTLLKEGLKIVLAGEPNVGKSSLLNALAGKETAIVTELPGTTRDAIGFETQKKGIPVHFTDTAGFRKAENIAEEKGMKITHQKLEEADLILWIFDVSEEPNLVYPQQHLSNGKEAILIFNKSDLPFKINKEAILQMFPERPSLETSALQNSGTLELETMIEHWMTKHSDLLECEYLINARHQEILESVLESLESAQKALREDLGDDLIASDLKNAIQKLDEFSGKSIDEEIIQSIFSRFCIGK